MFSLTLKELSALLVVLMLILAAIRYCHSTIKNKISPILASWIIITTSFGLGFITYLHSADNNIITNIGVITAFPQTFIILFVIILTKTRRNELKVAFRLDQILYLIGAGIILVFWYASKDADTSYLINQGLMFLGYIPVVIHLAWKAKKNTEDLLFWIAIFIAACTAIYPAFKNGNILSQVYIYRAVPSTLLMILLMLRLELKIRGIKIEKQKVKKFLLQALGGFIFWTGILTPYMVFVVRTSLAQYLKWFGMQAVIIPPLAPFSMMFITWFVNRFIKKERRKS